VFKTCQRWFDFALSLSFLPVSRTGPSPGLNLLPKFRDIY
jgi:hypothetical protein